MKMNDTVARIVEIMFQDVEMNEETQAIRDEVMNNCQERYIDLIESGVGEDDAIAAVIESLKGMEDVLSPYKKKTHCAVNEDELDEESGERHMIFVASEIHQINVALISEDVNVEASDDEDYHVIWNADEIPMLEVSAEKGVLKVERSSNETANAKQKVKTEFHVEDEMKDFIRTEEGKIEINMDSITRAMKSLGDKIKMQFTNGMNISFGSADGSVTIQVPENAIPHVKLQTTSGDIDVQDVALTDLLIVSTSGDVNIALEEEQLLGKLDVRTTSGDIEANVFTQDMTVASTSGDVEVEGRINQLGVNTISGDIDVRADVKNMTFKAISGDVDLRFDSEEIRDVRGSTISGDIDIELPDGMGFMEIHTQTRSGDVTTRCHTNGYGPTVTGSVTTMSGDITIS